MEVSHQSLIRCLSVVAFCRQLATSVAQYQDSHDRRRTVLLLSMLLRMNAGSTMGAAVEECAQSPVSRTRMCNGDCMYCNVG